MSDESTAKEILLASRFIVDVGVNASQSWLGDMKGTKYYVNYEDDNCVSQFKRWLKGVFLKGIPQTLTMMRLQKDVDGCEVRYTILGFFNIPDAQEDEHRNNAKDTLEKAEQNADEQ